MWSVTIARAGNGFRMNWEEENEDGGLLDQEEVIQDDECDGLKSGELLLFWVMDHFNFGGDKFDEKRLSIKRVRGDHYEPPSKTNEKT